MSVGTFFQKYPADMKRAGLRSPNLVLICNWCVTVLPLNGESHKCEFMDEQRVRRDALPRLFDILNGIESG